MEGIVASGTVPAPRRAAHALGVLFLTREFGPHFLMESSQQLRKHACQMGQALLSEVF